MFGLNSVLESAASATNARTRQTVLASFSSSANTHSMPGQPWNAVNPFQWSYNAVSAAQGQLNSIFFSGVETNLLVSYYSDSMKQASVWVACPRRIILIHLLFSMTKDHLWNTLAVVITPDTLVKGRGSIVVECELFRSPQLGL